ncbi:hypothetical protein H0H93_016276 [Arthromyces matolae]|nr:hypothetical protein H0H93_016276 [Arthromyces matolae]
MPRPCHCNVCCGAQVSAKTVWNHHKRPREQTNHLSLSDWMEQTGRIESRQDSGPDKETESDDDEDDDDEGVDTGSRKRARRLSASPDTELPNADDIHVPNAIDANALVRNNTTLPNEGNHLGQLDNQWDSHSGNEYAGQDLDADHPNYGSDFERPESRASESSGSESDTFQMSAIAHAQALLDSYRNTLDEDAPPLDDLMSDEDSTPTAHIESLRITQEYINLIKKATLDEDKLDSDTLHRLRNPIEGPVDLNDPDDKLSIEIFAASNASEGTYNQLRDAIRRRYPDNTMLTFHNVKKLIADLTGIVPVMDDMCINSCHAFTGPYADLDKCSICNEPRYDPDQLEKHGTKVPRQEACTFLLGPQIQTLRRSKQGAQEMLYLDSKIKDVFETLDTLDDDGDMVYDDIVCGSDILEFVEHVKFTEKDTLVSFSIDGVQLYQSKKSDTWIAIWKIENYSPDVRFKDKKIFPCTTIPGPNKPKVVDSFTFRALYHLSALQRENCGHGIPVWDEKVESIIHSRIFFCFGTADAVGMPELDGRVGHHGAQGCRIGCGMKGRHKPNSGHYFAAHLRPNGYTVNDCNHPDINLRDLQPQSVENYKEDIQTLMASADQTTYERNRKASGLSKPSILSGLSVEHSLPVPRCFPLDLMHLTSLNIPELLISMWRGTLKHSGNDQWDWSVLVGDLWQDHGKLVEDATHYFPSSFHRTPRNPAEKISSGYKATEWFLYFYGLGPAFFRVILPPEYWKNYCMLVAAIRIFVQRSITGHQVAEGYSLAIQFIEDYENLYYKRQVDRLHLCRPSIHTVNHLAGEVLRVGPGAYYSQYTMERAIGSLGKEIRQPSNPYANLSQRALIRCQLNGIVNLCPDLEHVVRKSRLPSASRANGPQLLHRKDRKARRLQNDEEATILESTDIFVVQRYGRMLLQNGQIARSIFNDENKKSNTRVSHNVKIRLDGQINYAQVRFYYRNGGEDWDTDSSSDAESTDSDTKSLRALVSIYSDPDPIIFAESCKTIWACRPGGSDSLRIIPASSILSLVSMQPMPAFAHEPQDLWFVVEKSSLEEVQSEEHNGYMDRRQPATRRDSNRTAPWMNSSSPPPMNRYQRASPRSDFKDSYDFSSYSYSRDRSNEESRFRSRLAAVTHTELFGAENPTYMKVYEERNLLKGELEGAKAQIRYLEDLTRMCMQLSSQSNINSLPPTNPPILPHQPTVSLQAKNKEDYPNVPYWTKEEWTAYTERCGRKGRSFEKLGFLTTSTGVPLDKARIQQMSDTSRAVFNELKQHNLAPTTWKKKKLTAKDFFSSRMVADFPEFTLCEGLWKVEAFATIRYPDWTATKVKEEGREQVIPSKRKSSTERPQAIKKHKHPSPPHEIIEIDDSESHPAASSPAPLPQEKPSSSLNSPIAHASVASTAPNVPQAPVPNTNTSPSSNDSLLDQSDQSSTISAPTHAPASIMAQSPRDPSSNTSTAAIPDDDDTAKSSISSQISSPSSQVSISISIPGHEQPEQGDCDSNSAGKSAPPRARRVLNPLKNLTVPPPKNLVPQSLHTQPASAPKKTNQKLLQAKEGVTSAKNLYIIDYCKTHPNATEAEFSTVWKGLDNATKEKYQQLSKSCTQARKQAKKAPNVPSDSTQEAAA